MKRMLKALTLTALLLLCAVLLPLPRAEAADSGACGDSLSWELDDEGNLTIRGTGAMWDYAFSGNTAPWGQEIKTVTLETGVASIGGYAFYRCSGLTGITIPEGVTSIGDYALYGCSGLTEITIPESVTSIGRDAFSDCSGLTEITIPESVTSIGNSDRKSVV